MEVCLKWPLLARKRFFIEEKLRRKMRYSESSATQAWRRNTEVSNYVTLGDCRGAAYLATHVEAQAKAQETVQMLSNAAVAETTMIVSGAIAFAEA